MARARHRTGSEEESMRKLIVGAQVSLDGVMQAPGGSTEDPTNGFRFGGWAMPYFDEVAGEEMGRIFHDFDLLLGRKTYEIFAAYWPYQDESGEYGGIARAFNKARKYTLSRSGEVEDRKSTRLNSSHSQISYAVFCLKKKKN